MWGFISGDTGWNDRAASVACRQLSFSGEDVHAVDIIVI